MKYSTFSKVGSDLFHLKLNLSARFVITFFQLSKTTVTSAIMIALTAIERKTPQLSSVLKLTLAAIFS